MCCCTRAHCQVDSARNPETFSSGFTLLEVMLATLILALVVSMITVSLTGALNVMDATRNRGEIYFRAQVAMERICDDLASAVLPERADFIGQQAEEGGSEAPLLRFVSTAHVLFNPEHDQHGMAVISYALRPDPDDPGQLVLLRSDRLLMPGADQDDVPIPLYYLLTDQLRSIRFTYLDEQGEELESWDTRVEDDASPDERKEKRRLPVAVRIRLEYWLDRETENVLPFQTTVEVPVGHIRIMESGS